MDFQYQEVYKDKSIFVYWEQNHEDFCAARCNGNLFFYIAIQNSSNSAMTSQAQLLFVQTQMSTHTNCILSDLLF
jgi:hypothetical protein